MNLCIPFPLTVLCRLINFACFQNKSQGFCSTEPSSKGVSGHVSSSWATAVFHFLSFFFFVYTGQCVSQGPPLHSFFWNTHSFCCFEFNPFPEFRATPDVLWYAECPSVLVAMERRENCTVYFLQQVIDSFVHINPVLPQASAQQVPS